MTQLEITMVSSLSELLSHPAPIIRGKGFLELNLLLPGPPGVNSAILEKENCSQVNYSLPDNPRRLWSSIKKGGRFGLEAPFDAPPTSDATSGHSNLTGSRMRGVQQWNNTSISWANIGGFIHPQGNPIEVAPEVAILVTRKDEKPGKLKKNLVVQDEIDTDSEGSDDIYGEQLEITTLI
ncbi:hypothetical protein O181_107138 [Austropuccinia psidii MF-1]|uniref:Uncharacterized protein n=1 Tax=Austropuccinia psidii MF-1 TaxID=1389203 RepID=A0A9Q3PMK5_9BASI|nr:hypothetical protein [Austropuccinia psidii MF-1]